MKKLALILCCIIMTSLVTIPVYASDIRKDETVYAQLDYDGKPQGQQVVNHLYSRDLLTNFTDITLGKDLVNLTDTTSPIINNNTVEWNNTKSTRDFYYQSSTNEALPFVFHIGYALNEQIVSGAELLGKTGNISISLSIKPNKQSNEYYRENMMSQISINLDSDYAKNIVASDATKVVAGKLTTLNYVVLAEQSGDFKITFEATDFKMEGMTISIIPSGFSLPDTMLNQLDDMTNGFSDMENAMGDMVNGTVKLKNGLDVLSNGVTHLHSGYQTFLGGTDTLINGMDSILNGVIQVGPSIVNMAEGSSNINNGLHTLSSNGNEIAGGMDQLNTGSQELASGHKELSDLAESVLSTSTDPLVIALAQGVLDEKEGINELNTNLSHMTSGTKEYVNGLSTLSTQYTAFHDGLKQIGNGVTPLVEGSTKLTSSLKEYKSGANNLGQGIGELNQEVKNIPNQVQKLVDGQKEFKNGIQEASTTISDGLKNFTENNPKSFPSFVNGDAQDVSSLQFIIKTPNIDQVKKDKPLEEITETKTFWERFLNLFRF